MGLSYKQSNDLQIVLVSTNRPSGSVLVHFRLCSLAEAAEVTVATF